VRAARVHAYGGPEAITIDDVEIGPPGTGEVSVRVEAAAINFPDLLIIADRYQVSAMLPFTPGSEFCGVVDAVGAGVEGFAPGDGVIGGVFTGAFAEQVVVRAAALTKRPPGLSAVDGAALRVTYRTALSALRSVAAIRPGEWVLVLGGAGGVGSASIDLAGRLGAQVIATARGSAKVATCRALGAGAVVDTSTEDLRAAVREATEGAGIDVVIDPVGGSLAETALRSLCWGGRFVTVGYASGEIPRIPLNLVLLKGVTILGLELRTFAKHRPAAATTDDELLARFVAEGLRPLVSAVHPLEEIVSALAKVAAHETTGKVVLTTA
jgi:NADPH:quinone reductase